MNVGLYHAAAALDVNDRWQELITRNLASSAVPGFRKEELSFSEIQAGQPAKAGVTGTSADKHLTLPRGTSISNFRQGEMKYTGSVTDVAIDGPAFFEVRLPDGSTAYTRDGEFQINADGELVTKQGYPVLAEGGTLQFDLDDPSPISISPEGEVSQGADVKGRIRLTEFDDERLLKRVSGSLFLGGDPALVSQPTTTSSLRQGWLEGANTSVVAEMANLITAMRTFEANQKVITMQDERMSKAINSLEGN